MDADEQRAIADFVARYQQWGPRERMSWVNHRKSELIRLAARVAQNAELVMEHDNDREVLDEAIQHLESRVRFVRQRTEAVAEANRRDAPSVD